MRLQRDAAKRRAPEACRSAKKKNSSYAALQRNQDTMKQLIATLLIVTITASVSGQIQRFAVYSTGMQDFTTQFANGQEDTHYRVISQPASFCPPTNAFARVKSDDVLWVPTDSDSTWIRPACAVNNTPPSGRYIYRTSFTLSESDLSSNCPSLYFTFAADNKVTNVYLNGIAQNIQGISSVTVWSGTGTIHSGFVQGLNNLDFHVWNDEGATGLRVAITGELFRADLLPSPLITEGIRLCWCPESNNVYTTQKSFVLEPDSWVNFGNTVTSKGALITTFDLNPTNEFLFYRILKQDN